MEKQVIEKIHVVQGDITQMDTDAIVNAANTSLLGGGGVDGAIHRAAGPELLAECRKIGGCPTGEARITKGYRLKAKYVIHTVGPIYSGTSKDSRLLTRCYENSLELAVKHHITSIAFPAISCGVYGYPIEQAVKIALKTTLSFLEQNPDIKKIVFVLFSPGDFNVYQGYLNQYRS